MLVKIEFDNCGDINHGEQVNRNYYPLKAYTPSSCQSEEQLVVLSCNDGVISSSVEDLSGLTASIDSCQNVEVLPSVTIEASLAQLGEFACQYSER